MYKKKTLILTLVFSLLIPLTVFSIMDERGAFDTRSQAQSQLREEFRVADIDNNSRVDLNDFEGWLEIWKGYKANKSEYTQRGDLDGDGSIGISDYAMWLEKWRGYKIYAENPEVYLEEKPEGLLAAWPLDEQTGTGSYIINTVSGEYEVTPVGTDVYSSGLFGSSILMGKGDSLVVRNGDELPIQNDSFIVSLWMNLLDNTMYDIGLNPNAFVWDRTEYAFKVVTLDSSYSDYAGLMQTFKSIDIETLIEDGTGGWFNLIAEYDNSTGMMNFFINNKSVGSYESGIKDKPEEYIVISLFPENIEAAFDNIQVWEGEKGYVETVYENSVDTFSNNSETNPAVDYYTYSYPEMINQEQEEDEYKYYKDPNYTYTVMGYDARDCIVCSPDYDYTYVHFDLAGFDNPEGQAADESLCDKAIKGYGDYSVDSSTIYYTCASKGRCGGIYSDDYQIDGYPGDSGTVLSKGLDTRAEYVQCLEYIKDDSNSVEEENPYSKSCSACSTRYYYIYAYWEGTCNEKTDAERLAADPNLIYKCRRCGSDGTSNSGCLLGGYPGPNDEIFQSHYSTSFGPEWGSAYDIYVKNCIDDREDCPSPIQISSKEGCSRCSTDFLYAYATWDPGPDGICYVDTPDDTYPKDDLFGSATYTCDCKCTANKRTFTGTWSGTDYSTYQQCKDYCDNL